jgi:Mrp family chromosome partitioning ATPase
MISAKTEHSPAADLAHPRERSAVGEWPLIFRPCTPNVRIADSAVRVGLRELLNRVRTVHSSDEPLFALGVTSCGRGEGVSTIAAALALLASEKLRVALVDAGPQRQARVRLGLPAGPIAAANGNGENGSHAGFLAVEELPLLLRQFPGPARSSREQSLQLLESLRRRFDLAIFDLPAPGEDETSLELGPLLDGVALVVASERVPWHAARKTVELLRQAETQVIGTVLNRHQAYVPKLLQRLS